VAKYNQRKQFLLCKRFLKGKVVDVGCGKKPFKEYFEDYIGVDVTGSPDIVASVTDLPLKDDSADSVICSEVLEHVSNTPKAMDEISRITKKGGHLYLTVPMYWYLHYIPNDYWRFTCYSLKLIVEKFGFDVKYINRTGGLNFFIANRISETIFDMFNKVFSRRVSLILLVPFQLILYAYSKLDKFNRRDAAGWVLLATKS